MGSIVQAPFNSFGQLAHSNEDENKLDDYFDIYQQATLIVSSILLISVGILIVPFVKIYTIHITDYDYVNNLLALFFFSQIFSQIINRPFGTILNATGNFKMQNIQCGFATIVNFVVSFAFIKYLGICSIVLGSFVGTLLILVMNVYQVYKHVLHGSMIHVLKKIVINYFFGLIIIIVIRNIQIKVLSYTSLCSLALVLLFIVSFLVLCVNYLIDKHSTKRVIFFIKKMIDGKIAYLRIR